MALPAVPITPWADIVAGALQTGGNWFDRIQNVLRQREAMQTAEETARRHEAQQFLLGNFAQRRLGLEGAAHAQGPIRGGTITQDPWGTMAAGAARRAEEYTPTKEKEVDILEGAPSVLPPTPPTPPGISPEAEAQAGLVDKAWGRGFGDFLRRKAEAEQRRAKTVTSYHEAFPGEREEDYARQAVEAKVAEKAEAARLKAEQDELGRQAATERTEKMVAPRWAAFEEDKKQRAKVEAAMGAEKEKHAMIDADLHAQRDQMAEKYGLDSWQVAAVDKAIEDHRKAEEGKPSTIIPVPARPGEYLTAERARQTAERKKEGTQTAAEKLRQSVLMKEYGAAMVAERAAAAEKTGPYYGMNKAGIDAKLKAAEGKTKAIKAQLDSLIGGNPVAGPAGGSNPHQLSDEDFQTP